MLDPALTSHRSNEASSVSATSGGMALRALGVYMGCNETGVAVERTS